MIVINSENLLKRFSKFFHKMLSYEKLSKFSCKIFEIFLKIFWDSTKKLLNCENILYNIIISVSQIS